MNLYYTQHAYYVSSQIIFSLTQETGEIHVQSCHRDIHVLVPNFQTVYVFGIVAIPTRLVVIPFLKVPSVKAHAHGTDSLA